MTRKEWPRPVPKVKEDRFSNNQDLQKCLKHKKGDMVRSKLYTEQEDKKFDMALIKIVQD